MWRAYLAVTVLTDPETAEKVLQLLADAFLNARSRLLSETAGAQKQEQLLLRGTLRLASDFDFRRLTQPQQRLIEDAGLQQAGEYLCGGPLVADRPARPLRPQVDIARELGITGCPWSSSW